MSISRAKGVKVLNEYINLTFYTLNLMNKTDNVQKNLIITCHSNMFLLL